MYKIEIFARHQEFFSKVEDLKHHSYSVSSVIGLSNLLWNRLSSLSTTYLQRCFFINPDTLQLAYNPGLKGGGCVSSRLETGDPTGKKEELKKIRAQYIEVKNDGAYEMCFYLEDENGYQSESTPIIGPWCDDTKIIDLASTSFAVGSEITLVVNILLEVRKSAEQKIQFHLNNKTMSYVAKGTTLSPSVKYKATREPEGKPEAPDKWLEGIYVYKVPFHNWDSSIVTPDLWTCAPRDENEAVAVCNWAAKYDFKVRPRGVMHGWSPLSVSSTDFQDRKILFLDTTKYLREVVFSNDKVLGPRVAVGTGLTLGELFTLLEKAPGGGTSASGWSFPHTPAPGHLTIGGIIAINGHGTAIPNKNENWNTSYGSMSNHILQLKAIVTDPSNPDEYIVKTFKRGEPDTKAFLTSLGRALILEVTLKVIPNYNLRCTSTMKIKWDVLCAAPTSDGSTTENSFSKFLDDSGRVELIWFPFSDCPWVKIWTNCDTIPSESRKVDGPNNYTFSDHLPSYITDLVKEITGGSTRTRYFCRMMESISKIGLKETKSRDIWGPSKNTLLYVRDQTLRVTANGYAIHTTRKDVQKVVHLFAHKYHSMLLDYESKGKYPINSPLEIRVTGLDNSKHVPTENDLDAGRPLLSALASDSISEANKWDVAVWLDVLTTPGAPDSNEYFAEMEQWFLETFNGDFARVRPEWSKGWAYTKNQGAWHSDQFSHHFRESFTIGHDTDDNWNWVVSTFAKYDSKNLFSSNFTEKIFRELDA